MSQFEVGEIAVISDSVMPDWPVGMEVTILSIEDDCDQQYLIDEVFRGHTCTRTYANDRCLRKRRPPQDWQKICNLHELAIEPPKEVA